ncbi:hypothetical protein Tco_1421630 [Tanacetum coccineum]
MVAKKPPSVDKITPTVTSEGTGDKPGVPDVIEDESTKSESESWGNDEDNNNNDQDSSNEDSKHENESEEQVSDSEQEDESDDDDQKEEEFVHTPSPTDDKDDDNLESESDDVIKSDEEKGMDDTKEVVQGEGVDVEMHDAQQGNENLETTQEQVVEDTHVTISTVTKKTKVHVTSSSLSSDLASKFLNFSDIPQADAEIFSLLDVHVHHEVPRTEAPTLLSVPVSVIPESITALEIEVVELKKDPLHTQVTSLVDDHLDTRLEETREEFMNFLLESLTARIKEQVKDQLPQILPKEVSKFALPVIENLIKESCDKVTLVKVSSQPHSTYEAASTLTEFELKKIFLTKWKKHGRKDKDKDEDPSVRSDRGLKKRKLSKDAEPTTGLKKKDSTSGSSKGTKSLPKVIMKMNQGMRLPLDVIGSRNLHHLKNLPTLTRILARLLRKDQPKMNGLKIENLTQEILLGPAFRLLKGTRSNYAELEYDFEECYKALSENLDWENPKGSDYPFDLSKPLPLITHRKRQRVPFEFFINNDLKYLQRGILTMTYTTSTTKTKAAKYDLPGIEDMVPNIWSPVKVAYDKYALWVTHVKVMRKHGYGYLEEIIVRRADNVLYRFKEGDFPRLQINDIEDMLILVVQNQLTNLSGDDVADFAITMRMLTRSLVI